MPNNRNKGFARRLRRDSTDAERHLWYWLRGRRICGAKFRRQYPIDRYVVDFISLEHRLVIELDGGQHSEQQNYDLARTRAIEAVGFRVLRFWNDDVLTNTESVLSRIMDALRADLSPGLRPALTRRFAPTSPPAYGRPSPGASRRPLPKGEVSRK